MRLLTRPARWIIDVTENDHERVIFHKRFRYYLWLRDRGRCQYCGREVDPRHGWHVEHILPYSVGKAWEHINDEDNLCVACIPCNLKKGVRLQLPRGYYQLPPYYWRTMLKIIVGAL